MKCLMFFRQKLLVDLMKIDFSIGVKKILQIYAIGTNWMKEN